MRFFVLTNRFFKCTIIVTNLIKKGIIYYENFMHANKLHLLA